MEGEPFDVRRRNLVPLLLVPSSTADPLAWPRLVRSIADHRDDFIPVLCSGEPQLHQRVADADEMTVAFDKTGNGELAAEV